MTAGPPIRLTPKTRAVLAELLAEPGLHGYEVHKRAHVGLGSLYPILGRLETRGYATSWWVGDPHPRRRCYALTPAGEALAQQPRHAPKGQA